MGSSRRWIAGWKTGCPSRSRRKEAPWRNASEVSACRLRSSTRVAAASWESRMRDRARRGAARPRGDPGGASARSRTPLRVEPGERARGRRGAPGAGLASADHLDPAGGHLGGAPQAAAAGEGDPPLGPAEPGGLPLVSERLRRFAGSARRCSRSRARAGVIRASSGSQSPAVSMAMAASAGSSGGGEGSARRAWPRASRTAFSSAGEVGGAGTVDPRAPGLAHPHQDRALVQLVAVAPPLARALLAAAGLQPGDLCRLGGGGGQRVLQA